MNQPQDKPTGYKSSPQKPSIKRVRKPWYSQGWIWLIVAIFGIWILYYGFSGVIDQLTHVDQSIKENTSVLKDQNFFLYQIKQEMSQLIGTVKDSVYQIIQVFHSSKS